MRKNQFILCLIMIFMSCSYSTNDCEELAFKISQGNISLMGNWDDNCSTNKDAKYTVKLCNKALSDLILVGNEKLLQKKYGEKIINCFTKKQKELFLKN